VWPLSIMARKVQSLELETDSYLAFTTGQELQNLTNPRCAALRLVDVARLGTEQADVRGIIRASGFEPIHRRGVIAIEKVEHFEQHLRFNMVSEVEPLGETHVQVDEGGGSMRVSSV
jgi:hypothetical protein